MRMKKQEIEVYSERCGRNPLPSINVKNYTLPFSAVQKHFNLDDAAAEKAIGFAFDSACQRFWDEAQEIAIDTFGNGVKVWQMGRLGGHLCVEGLSPVEEWDAIDLSKWVKFENAIKSEIKYLTSAECFIEDIDVNKWYLPYAEMFNFCDTKDSGIVCLAELKQAAIDAGFGKVVRL